MPILYTVSFTTQKIVNKYDSRGKLISQEPLDTPIVMHHLPLMAAQSYSKCDNFAMSHSEFTDGRNSRKAPDPDRGWAGAATKKVARHGQSTGASPSTPKAAPKVDKIAAAARTGNLGAGVSA